VPLQEPDHLRFVEDPTQIKSEGAQLVGYAYVDMTGRDTGSYLEDARKMVDQRVKLPAGYRLEWSGSYEEMQRAGRTLKYVIPVTLGVIFLLLYLNDRSVTKALIVMIAVPFSLTGAFLLLRLLGYHRSVAVWVGIIALVGVDAETGMVMLLYLDVA
jgi:Cu(I)/Ag(I) efflux system membrane protein CusA/SilA